MCGRVQSGGPSRRPRPRRAGRKLFCFVCHKPNPGFDSTRFADHIAPSVPVCGKACEAKYLHSKELKPVVVGKVAQRLSFQSLSCMLQQFQRAQPQLQKHKRKFLPQQQQGVQVPPPASGNGVWRRISSTPKRSSKRQKTSKRSPSPTDICSFTEINADQGESSSGDCDSESEDEDDENAAYVADLKRRALLERVEKHKFQIDQNAVTTATKALHRLVALLESGAVQPAGSSSNSGNSGNLNHDDDHNPRREARIPARGRGRSPSPALQ